MGSLPTSLTDAESGFTLTVGELHAIRKLADRAEQREVEQQAAAHDEQEAAKRLIRAAEAAIEAGFFVNSEAAILATEALDLAYPQCGGAFVRALDGAIG